MNFASWFSLTPIGTSDLVLIISAVILLVYTFFTLKLWRQSIIQTYIGLLPFPVVYMREDKATRKRKFRIRNLGYGPMLNTKIEEFNLTIKDMNNKKISLKFSVPSPNVLATNEERDLLSEAYSGDARHNDFDNILTTYLDPQYALHKNALVPLKVTFEDSRGTKYKTIIGFGTGGLAILEPPQRIGFLQKLRRV